MPYAHRLAGHMRAATEAEGGTVEIPAAELAWLATLAAGLGAAAEAIEARNALLREAAELVPGGLWARAVVIAAVAGGLPAENPKIAERVRAAAGFAPLPRTTRQYLRILE